MLTRLYFSALLVATAAPGAAQTFSPREQQLLMHPSPLGGPPGSFQRPAVKPVVKTQRAKGETAKSARSGAPVSISSELHRGMPGASPVSTYKPPQSPPPQQKSPLDQRVPFGPLSLGLQAEAGPRSDALVTPVPAGINQFKKDRSDPYVGVSIIDIKR
jgi:hypothetical protein